MLEVLIIIYLSNQFNKNNNTQQHLIFLCIKSNKIFNLIIYEMN